MKKSTLAIIIAILSVGILGGVYLYQKDEPSTSETPTISTKSTNNTNGTTKTTSYTSAEVATHKTTADCWTIVNGNVYDLTSYVSRHPGGDDIELACGVDGTTLFTERKTEDGKAVGSGTPHDSGSASQLESLKIGTLAN